MYSTYQGMYLSSQCLIHARKAILNQSCSVKTVTKVLAEAFFCVYVCVCVCVCVCEQMTLTSDEQDAGSDDVLGGEMRFEAEADRRLVLRERCIAFSSVQKIRPKGSTQERLTSQIMDAIFLMPCNNDNVRSVR